MELTIQEAVAVEPRLFTAEEYLAMEECALEKSQFNNGKIIPMPGGTYEHNLITANAIRELGNALRAKNSPCVVLSSDMKIYIATQTKFYYADASVVCSAPKFYVGRRDAIENPTVIVEVASDSTGLFDRTDKFDWYATLETFKEYVLIAQKQPHVEVWTHQKDNIWEMRIYKTLDDRVRLETIDCEIDLAKIYASINFEEKTV